MDGLETLFESRFIIGLFIKLFGIVLGLLYLFFSIILVKQVQSMKRTVTVHDGGMLLMTAYVQVGISLIIVAYALFFL